MKLDRRDIEFLQLAMKYQRLPLDTIKQLGFDGIAGETELLAAAGLRLKSRSMVIQIYTPHAAGTRVADQIRVVPLCSNACIRSRAEFGYLQ